MKRFKGLFAGLAVAAAFLFVTPEAVDAACKECETIKCKRGRPGRCVLDDYGSADRCRILFCSKRKRACAEVGTCDSWGSSILDSGRVTTPGVIIASVAPSLDDVASSRLPAASRTCTPPPVTRVACVLENGTLSGACRPDLTATRQARSTGLLTRQATAP